MASLYEINSELNEILETAYAIAAENEGEIPENVDKHIEALKLDFDIKVSNCIAAYKNALAEAAMVEAELKAHQRRVKTLKTRAEWLKAYLSGVLAGRPWRDSKHVISWRKSKAVQVPSNASFETCPEHWHKTEHKWVLTEIKKDIEAGKELDGFKIIEHNNIQIK